MVSHCRRTGTAVFWGVYDPRMRFRGHSPGRILAVRVLGILSVVAGATVGGLPTRHADAAQVATILRASQPETVAGVPLIPITASQLGECQKFASQLKRRVPCPGLLPDPIPASSPSDQSCLGVMGEDACGQAVIEVSRSLFLLSQSNFKVPPGYVGVSFQQYNGTVVPETSIAGGPLGHFVFMAGTDLPYDFRIKPRKGAPPVPAYCSPVTTSQTLRVHGAVAKLYQCSDSSSSQGGFELIMGHDLLVWNDSGITCEVSFHGHSQANFDLDIAVANATTLVSPKRR